MTDRLPTRPAPIGDLIAQLFAVRGYGRVEASRQLADVWNELLGPTAAQTRLGTPKRGTLEVRVSHSVVMQELNFRRDELLRGLQEKLPEAKIARFKFRVGLE